MTNRIDKEKNSAPRNWFAWIEVKTEGKEIDEYFIDFADGYEDEYISNGNIIRSINIST